MIPLAELRPTRGELREMMRIAAPIVLAQVGMMLMGVVDTAMVGRVSPEAIAAVALAHIYWANLFLAALGLLLVLDPVVSQAVGARDRVGIARGVQRGVIMAVALSVLMSLALIPGRWLFTVLRQPEDVIPITATVAHWLIPGVLPSLLFVVFRQTLQAMGKARAIVISIVVANVLNALLNWVLIYGHWGFPAMGPAGSAISTVIGRWVMLAIIVAGGWRALIPTLSPWRPESFATAPMMRMLHLGLPVAFQQWLEIAVFALGGIVIGTFGSVPLAGHEIVLNLASITFMVPLGVGAAAAAMVGRAIGRDDVAAARRDAVAALSVGVGFMALTTVAFTAAPALIAGWFAADAATVAFSASLLPIAGLFQIFDGMQCVSAGVLRGTGDTRVPMLLHLGGFWGVGIPLCLLLTFPLGLGPKGVWWGFVASLIVVAVLQMNRMRWRLAQDIKRLHFDH